MISLDDLKTSLRITGTDKNTELELCISNAIGFVKSYLMYDISYSDSRIATYCKTDNSFELPFVGIISIGSIKYGEDEFDASLTTYSGLSKLYKESGLLKTKEYIGAYVEITYEYGFDIDTTVDDVVVSAVNPTPEGLKAVLLSIASKYYKNLGEVSMGDIRDESVAGDRIGFKENVLNQLTPSEKDILDKYKTYGFSS